MKKSPILLILSFVCMLYITVALAEEEHMTEHEHSRHHAAVFMGNTRKDGENAYTIGADYGYRLTPLLSVGGLVDHAGGDIDETIVAATLSAHPLGGLKLLLGIGASFAEEKEEVEEEVIEIEEDGDGEGEVAVRTEKKEEKDDSTDAAVRLGASYEFEVGAFSLSPTVNVDLVDGDDAWLFGLNLGRSF